MKCPVCSKELHLEQNSFVCENGHRYDRSRKGYVNLSRKQKVSGDNKRMVKSRTAFLESGAYQFLRDALTEQIRKYPHNALVDLGCGQGYYTAEFAKEADQAWGIDLSRDAVDHAAGQDKKTQYIVGSIYDLPFQEASVDMLTSVFTPLPSKEAARVLKKDGIFITTAPGRDHLKELKGVLYETVKLNGEPPAPDGFDLIDSIEIQQMAHVDRPMDLLEMTPYLYRSPKKGIEALASLDNGLDTTFDFIIQIWRKKSENEN